MNEAVSTTEETRRTERLRRTALHHAAIAAMFSLLVLGAMVGAHVTSDRSKPPSSEPLIDARSELGRRPSDKALAEAIRGEDLAVRRAYFQKRAFFRRGAYLLIAGVLVFVTSLKRYLAMGPELKPAGPRHASEEEQAADRRRSQVAVAALAGIMLAGLAVMAVLGSRTEGPHQRSVSDGSGTTQPAVRPQPTSSSFKDNWPRFRGPGGNGVLRAGAWPTDWNGSQNRNIRWKCPLPSDGKGSPVIWGGRIFLTAGDDAAHRVVCIDRQTGRILWNQVLKRPPPMRVKRSADAPADDEPFRVPEDTGWAAPTPATDGRFVYVTFATSDVACFDLDGRQVWARNFGKPDSIYGLAGSLVVWNNILIFQLDQGGFAEDGLSALYGLDAKTGGTLWRTRRPVPNSWTTPIVINVKTGPQLVTSSDPYVIAYEPSSGKEIWRVSGLSGDIAPSAIFAEGRVFAANTNAKLLAIRPDGKGDVTKTHVEWAVEGELPDVCSPVSDGNLVLCVTGNGQLTAFDAMSGTVVWEKKLPGEFSASPTLAGDVVYLPSMKGKTHIFRLSEEFEPIAEPDLGEGVHATPAFGDGCIYIRGEKHLYCIGDAQQTVPPSGKQ